ncbi:MAG: M23 family metallopeptidase, partial [Bdellovibrionales bacterium]|nr:M23 family metallopeptidase [Bdellovibrionales bacterium]
IELNALLEGVKGTGLFDIKALHGPKFVEPESDDLSGIGGEPGTGTNEEDPAGDGIGGEDISPEEYAGDGEFTPSALNELSQTSEAKVQKTNLLIEQLDRTITLLRRVPVGFPGNGYINSLYGLRKSPFNGRVKLHQGVDLALPLGSYVHATADGTVLSVKRTKGYGLVVDIQHSKNVITRFAHLSDVVVREGEEICRGEYVGLVGSTGYSTGPHLHYEVRVGKKSVDPRPLMLLPDRVNFGSGLVGEVITSPKRS